MHQDEYFSVQAQLTINVEPLSEAQPLPSMDAFSEEIPALFRVASECTQLEEGAEKALAQFSKDESQPLATYLSAQNKKINLLLSFVLSQQDNPEHRFQTDTFGASQLSFRSQQPLNIGSSARVKIFLNQPPAAIYCYGEITQCIEDKQGFQVSLKYTRLLEEDQDLLIRAALYLQQRFLRQRAQQRTDKQQ